MEGAPTVVRTVDAGSVVKTVVVEGAPMVVRTVTDGCVTYTVVVRAADGLIDATSVVVIVSEVVTVVRDCAKDKEGSTARARPKRTRVNIVDGSIVQIAQTELYTGVCIQKMKGTPESKHAHDLHILLRRYNGKAHRRGGWAIPASRGKRRNGGKTKPNTTRRRYITVAENTIHYCSARMLRR